MLLFKKGQKGAKYTKMIVVCDMQERNMSNCMASLSWLQ